MKSLKVLAQKYNSLSYLQNTWEIFYPKWDCKYQLTDPLLPVSYIQMLVKETNVLTVITAYKSWEGWGGVEGRLWRLFDVNSKVSPVQGRICEMGSVLTSLHELSGQLLWTTHCSRRCLGGISSTPRTFPLFPQRSGSNENISEHHHHNSPI